MVMAGSEPIQESSTEKSSSSVLHWLKARLSDLPRISVLLSFIGFGVYSFVHPTAAMAALTPIPEHATYVLFILSGLFLVLGTYWNFFEVYVIGHIFCIVSLITVSLVVFVTNESSIAILTLGYAAVLGASLQKVFLERRILREINEDTQPHSIVRDDT